MKYWTRTTHNFNNETREWEYKEELELVDLHADTNSALGVHALDSGRWSNLDEIYNENERYCKQYPYDTISIDKEMLLKELEQLEKLGLVKSKER